TGSVVSATTFKITCYNSNGVSASQSLNVSVSAKPLPTTTPTPSVTLVGPITISEPSSGMSVKVGVNQAIRGAINGGGGEKVELSLYKGDSRVSYIGDVFTTTGGNFYYYPWQASTVFSTGSDYRMEALVPRTGESAYGGYFTVQGKTEAPTPLPTTVPPPPSKPASNYGDVDANGIVSATDSLLVQQYIAGSRTFSTDQK